MKNRTTPGYQQSIIDHYSAIWKSNPEIYLWDRGPIEKLYYEFRVLEYPPDESRELWTYATCGMSSLDNDLPIELHICSARQDVQLVELLTSLAYYHKNETAIALNHTVNFGIPWQGNSKCEYAFISLPYLDGPALEDFNFGDRLIKCFWLIPVTEAEVEYRRKYGTEALEEKFDEGLDFINPERRSVV